MKITCVWEHNGDDTLLYSTNFVGAYSRGPSKELALSKIAQDVISYLKWQGKEVPVSFTVEIVGEKDSELEIRDADSDVIFDDERTPLTLEEYLELKALALKSAGDFLALYESVPDKDSGSEPARKTFYGQVPRTAREMYEHTKSVNAYYFGEIEVDADNEGTILECRERGFKALEAQPDFLRNTVIDGSYGEQWSLRKVLRRFLWHDRIHAKAMWRAATQMFGSEKIVDPFYFGETGDK